MNYQFRKAEHVENPQIWAILKQAIERRKQDGSTQWQDGYPNPEVIQKDIDKGAGYVLTEGETVIGYCAVLINDEPEYENIEGKWLTDSDFVVFHRIAISEGQLGKGLAQIIIEHIEAFAIKNKIHSIKADTNYDNPAMTKIFDKMNYTFCGIVHFRGTPRNAYEKVIVKA
jgi:GNAT superfamily N-acetyltransferase